MADGKAQNTSSVNTGPLVKGMVKDTDDSYTPKGAWYHARNAMSNSRDGNLGTLANEPSNLLCSNIPYTVIGVIHMHDDIWAIFSTDDTNSEIGTFDDSRCLYTPIKNSLGQAMNPINCLGFKRTNLIKGVAKENFDCTWQVYFADGLNSDRTINMDKPAFVENCVTVNNCLICTPTTNLDCDKLKITSPATVPCLTLSRGPNGGSLLNGSYYAVVAYVLNSQRVTNYFMPSNTVAIFEHDNASGSLLITVDQIDRDHFDYFELVIVRTINSQTSAKKIGIYSTRQVQISIDTINEALESVPIESIPFRSPSYDISDGMFETGQYLIRTGPRAKFDFNYQPLANRITTKWQAVAYPSNYYVKGGTNTGYMRDEVYSYFIRWIYDTGEKSSSYHIPGRPAKRGAAPSAFLPVERDLAGNLFSNGGSNTIEITDPIAPYIPGFWEVYNTGVVTAGGIASPGITPPLKDGGVLIAEGEMAYWQSTEIYPDNKPDIYNASAHPFSAITVPPYSNTVVSDYDLCGQPIRHHKFPDNETIPHFRFNPSNPAETQIVILGVAFGNILPPVDNNGVLIPGIVGYEILRSSREGNKTVIAKGIINNMRTYQRDDGLVGLYQNYPYNPLGADPALTPVENKGENPIFTDHGPLSGISRNQFTFHSPDTSFNNPFLSSRELKLYGELFGDVIGSFDESPKHPKHKLITDIAFLTASLVGIGAAIVSMRGKKTETIQYPHLDYSNAGTGGFAGPAGAGTWASPSVLPFPANVVDPLSQILFNTGAWTAAEAGYDVNKVTDSSISLGQAFAKMLSSLDPGEEILLPSTYLALLALPGTVGFQKERQIEQTQLNEIPTPLRVFASLPIFSHYWVLGTDTAMDLITALVPYTQYAMRYTSHGFLNKYAAGSDSKATATFRYQIFNSLYLGDGIQDFGENSNAKINNVYRNKTVALQTTPILNTFVSATDNTAQTIGSSQALRAASPSYDATKGAFDEDNAGVEFTTRTISHYAALKNRMRNQYGQLDGIIQIPVSTCPVTLTFPLTAGTTVAPTGVLFNGDIYIGRYTEKNTFFYFWDWLYDQPDGFEYDYRLRYMVNFPRYWADFTKFDPGNFLDSFVSSILTLTFSNIELPSKKHSMDGPLLPGGFSNIFTAIFRVTQRYFYLFSSGVRDFFVESEINVDLRDWEEPPARRHYDPARYTSIESLFEPSIIKSGNFFKYDQSLSISRIFNNFFSWGNIQERDYDPKTAASCFTYYPNRLIYSLPQQLELRKDYWRVFPVNNYKDFKSRITAVRPINKTGAIILFQTQSPVMFTGIDQLQSDLGIEITVGDGGLFRREPQAIVNTDTSYEYGSSQDRLSVINTKYGLYWISQNQGKIFNYSGRLNEISKQGLWFWLSTYLPYKLTEDFPNFQLIDNPVIGIGCQTIYDNQEDVVYFCKKDWKLKPQFLGQIVYVSADNFLYGALPIKLGDPTYFDDASWTLSYDPKDKFWVSFHDWHPDLTMPSKNEFLSIIHDRTTRQGSIWRHNIRTDSFCNFYNQDFPFEIDRIAATGPQVNTLRSVEYYMEAYIYKTPTNDIYEVLDANFDHAVIYNREQVSGILILNQMPKNNVAQRLLYPIINPTSIDILVDKVEQKYRLNQFWDITADRGEFTFPTVQRPIWITQPNGYVRDLNPANLNYQKNAFERKKFRHYANHIRLYKNISGNINFVVKLVNVKELLSLR